MLLQTTQRRFLSFSEYCCPVVSLAGGGVDTIFGDQGADTIRGGGSDDRLEVGESLDMFYGGSGADLLDGAPPPT